MEGEGTYKTLNGDLKAGVWKNSKLNGPGEMRNKYEIWKGIYKDDQLEGEGYYKSELTGEYKGEFLHNKEHGKGIKIWESQ